MPEPPPPAPTWGPRYLSVAGEDGRKRLVLVQGTARFSPSPRRARPVRPEEPLVLRTELAEVAHRSRWVAPAASTLPLTRQAVVARTTPEDVPGAFELRQLRESLGWSQRELAWRSGVSRGSISACELTPVTRYQTARQVLRAVLLGQGAPETPPEVLCFHCGGALRRPQPRASTAERHYCKLGPCSAAYKRWRRQVRREK